MTWTLSDSKTILTTIPFAVEELQFSPPKAHPYHRLKCPDWVNILPITSDHRAVLIRQYRAGALSYVLETPGGVMDTNEKDPTQTAIRELEEETGFTSQRVLPLATLNPNPAIQYNRNHFFLALGCHPNPERRHFPDVDEDIKVELVPVADLDHMVRTGQINHGIAALCIMLAGKYIKIAP